MKDMNAEERIAQLEAENAALLAERAAWQTEAKELRAQLALAQNAQSMARVHELEGQRARTSHNSRKPLSSDGLARKMMSQRKPGGKKRGRQPGREGHHLIVPAIVFGVFIVIAIPVSLYILSLPLSQITGGVCSSFSGYQLSNCVAFYQRQGGADVLQQYAQIALWTLWIGLFTGGVCTFFVFPRISLSGTLKGILLFIGLLSALLLASTPLYLFAKLTTYGFYFALSLIIGCLALEIFLVSPTKEVASTEEPPPSMQQK